MIQIQDNGADHQQIEVKFHHDAFAARLTGAAVDVEGDNRANLIDGSTLDDVMHGSGGNDILAGYLGNDLIDGGAGDDDLAAGAGNDKLLGGAGDDSLFGGSGTDVLQGGNDNDTISAGAGRSTIDGGDGYDKVRLSHDLADYQITQSGHVYTLTDGAETEQVSNVEELDFADQTMLLYGSTSSLVATVELNTLMLSGTSALGAAGGLILLDASFPPHIYDNGAIRVEVPLDGEDEFTTVDASGLTDTGVEVHLDNIGLTAKGSNFADVMRGSAGCTLIGRRGDDHLTGGTGNDFLTGGAGNDLLDGSGGIDTVNYTGKAADYGFGIENGVLVVTDERTGAPSGVDKVGNVELFQFGDKLLTIVDVLDLANAHEPTSHIAIQHHVMHDLPVHAAIA